MFTTAISKGVFYLGAKQEKCAWILIAVYADKKQDGQFNQIFKAPDIIVMTMQLSKPGAQTG